MAIQHTITGNNRARGAWLSRSLALSVFCKLLFVTTLTVPLSLRAVSDQKQLETIRQHIAEKEKSVQQQQQQRYALYNQLQQQDTIIAQVSNLLHETQLTLVQLNKEIASFTQSVHELQRREATQQTILAQQLNAAFRQGRYNGWELILNGGAGLRRERILGWFSYLNHARYELIEKLKQTRAELAAQKKMQQQKQEQQKLVLAEQKIQKDKLESVRTERKKNLSTLETSLKKDQISLTQLKENEIGLSDQIAQAEQVAKARLEHEAKARAVAGVHSTVTARAKQPARERHTAGVRSLMERTDGLGRPNGQAIWPLHGPVIHTFGEILQGELRWKGMVISAPEGTKVKAIADGNVLLTEWLQGYGLVVVIEHGTSDMSVYGYTQNALVEVGAPVKAGEPVALVGDSGGQGYPALYLEIRRQGVAVNPQPWLEK